MPTKEEKLAKMDRAAELAANDLLQRIDSLGEESGPGVMLVAQWFEHHYRTAGYKRLSRYLFEQVLPRMESGEI